jgi:SAM-dependent methyltransferase
MEKRFEQYCVIASKISGISISEIKEIVKYIEDKEFDNDEEVIHSSKYIKQWYDSIKESGSAADYSLYDDKYYIGAGWLSYKKWSSKHVKVLADNKKLFEGLNIIIDFGCGIGYSTLDLCIAFPEQKIIGTNLKGIQLEICKEICKDRINVEFVTDNKFAELPVCDLAFCSEYFEHFYEPIAHLREILLTTNPKYVAVANAFRPLAVGHFNKYLISGKIRDCEATKVMFNNVLAENYAPVTHDGFNNRPNIWKKI